MSAAANKTVSVNMAVGHLIFYANNTFEFKTIGTLPLQQKFLSRLGDGDSKANDNQFQLHKDQKNKVSSLIKNQDDNQEYEFLSNFLKD